MRWICLVGFVLWSVTSLAVKAVLTRRWPGTAFVQLNWRLWNDRDWIASLLAGFAFIPLTGAIVPGVAGTQIGPRLHPSWSWGVVGAGLVAIAVVVMVWSQLTMGASWRVGVNRSETTALITTGPFRWVRNPIYTSMVVTATGLSVLMPTVGTIFGTLALLAFVEWQVRAVEEPFLLEGHGPDYGMWSARTGRFVPSVGCR